MPDASQATPGNTWPIPQYYRVSDIAQRLALSEKTITRRIQGDPDVLVLSERRRGVRRYQTYLVPDVALQRLVDSLKPRV